MENKNNELTRITLDLPTAKHREFKSAAALKGASMRDLLIDAVDRILAERHQEQIESIKSNYTPTKGVHTELI